MDLARASNQPHEFLTLSGKILQISPGTARQVGKLQSWLNKQPAPKRSAAEILPQMPQGVQLALAKAAQESSKDWPPEVLSSEGWRAINATDAGRVEVLRSALEKHHPDIAKDPTLVDALFDDLTGRQFNDIGLAYFGFLDAPVPKGETVEGEPEEATGATEPATP